MKNFFLFSWEKIKHFVLKKFGIIKLIESIILLKKENLELKVVLSSMINKEYEAEGKYILQNGLCVFPYKRLLDVTNIDSGYDKQVKLPYVIHKGKKLYFPEMFSIKKCRESYYSYICEECLLGGRYLEKQPHQYLTDNFKIEEGDIVVDVGCAEALLVLDNIDILKKAYLFESDKKWIAPLSATFRDYQDKVFFINKYVSDRNSETEMKLETALSLEIGEKMFVKMDIEGAEVSVLKGSKDFFSNTPNIKLVCCTYHRQNDSEQLLNLLEDMGYKHEFSEGFMLFLSDKNQSYPFFRHGLLRAWK